MPDLLDHIQEQQLATLARQIADARYQVNAHSAFVCEDCDAPIPQPRRIALPGVQCCISCQQIREARNRHYRQER
ncbi:TraR/DksA C4-type zinc finger protein [Sodalis sp. RH15]|uniref:TraR/DksA C4-type zinc finger protein n=1 Tax=Sodalis sp. RH15 TaxID=3394330 RepID=UPI0039B60002